jgi:hypothetical protein
VAVGHVCVAGAKVEDDVTLSCGGHGRVVTAAKAGQAPSQDACRAAGQAGRAAAQTPAASLPRPTAPVPRMLAARLLKENGSPKSSPTWPSAPIGSPAAAPMASAPSRVRGGGSTQREELRGGGGGGGWLISGVPRRSGRPAEDHKAAATSTEREGPEERAWGRVTGGRRWEAREK